MTLRAGKLVITVIILVLLYESMIGILRKLNRRRVFRMAKQRAEAVGLPLLVIGDPYNGLMSIATGPDYGCGDLCLDLTGCPRCPVGSKSKLEDACSHLNFDNYVVFISCVLEYVDDLPLIMKYLNRMNPDNLFVVNVEPYSLTAYLYPYYLTNEEPPKYVIYDCPPWQSKITYKKDIAWGS
jgi:hypothetical protein